jgi:ABC-type multidrug transport system ATPase subunit
VLYEVERMASQILLIHRGRLLAFGDVRAIRAAMDDRPHRVLLVSRDPQRLAALLTERALVSGEAQPKLQHNPPDDCSPLMHRLY